MIKVKVVGAAGYGGVGIIELITQHPKARLAALVDQTDLGTPISVLYPHLSGFCDMPLLASDDPQALVPADVVFFATPDRVGMTLARGELAKGAKIIDYSGDYRFTTTEAYADYAARLNVPVEHATPDLLTQCAYGMAELHRAQIRKADIVGNPGCFACSCTLGLAPAVKNNLIKPGSIICDCKTGTSGAGKKANPAFHYPARYEQMNAYRLAGHQHVCEIEHELSKLAKTEIKVTFTAQVVPTTRGILSTLYGDLYTEATEREVWEMYRDFYAESPFVRVFGSNASIGTLHVRGTNYCNLVVSVDPRLNRLRIVSHIDNLVKGQAGSALQNMNLLCGLPETTGLERPGIYP